MVWVEVSRKNCMILFKNQLCIWSEEARMKNPWLDEDRRLSSFKIRKSIFYLTVWCILCTVIYFTALYWAKYSNPILLVCLVWTLAHRGSKGCTRWHDSQRDVLYCRLNFLICACIGAVMTRVGTIVGTFVFSYNLYIELYWTNMQKKKERSFL